MKRRQQSNRIKSTPDYFWKLALPIFLGSLFLLSLSSVREGNNKHNPDSTGTTTRTPTSLFTPTPPGWNR